MRLVEQILRTILVVIIPLSSCSDDKYIDTARPKIVKGVIPTALECERLHLKNELLMGAAFIDCFDSSLIIGHSKQQYLFTVLSLKNKEYVNIFRKGRGPDEYIPPIVLRSQTCNRKKELGQICFNDINNDLIYWLNIKSSLINKRAIIIQVDTVQCYHDCSFVLNDGKITSFINNKGIMTMYIDDAMDKHSISKIAINHSNAFFYDDPPFIKIMSEDNRYLAFISILLNQISILDMQTSRFSSYTITGAPNLNDYLYNKSHEESYYIDAKAKKDYLVALYQNNNTNSTPNQIHIIGWKGNVKAILDINEELLSICISDNLKSIYALSSDETVVRYDISYLML